jgi:DNA modification methylase
MSAILLLQGDALHLPLEDKSIHTIITSPPYFGLRQYNGLEPTVWPGGSYCPGIGQAPVVIPGPTPEQMAACAHAWGTPMPGSTRGGSGTPNGRNNAGEGYARGEEKGATCARCDAWKGVLGNEPTPAMFTWHMVLVLRECYRVLRDDGTLFLNIGDSSSSGNRVGHGTVQSFKQQTNRGMNGTNDPPRPTSEVPDGNLLGIPYQVVLAAQAEGWVWRETVTYQKLAPMPESISGWRHEYTRCRCLQPTRITAGQQKAPHAGHREHAHGGVTATPATTPDPACVQCSGTGRLPTRVLRRGSWRHTRSTEPIFMLVKQMGYWANGEEVKETAHARSRPPTSRNHAGTKSSITGTHANGGTLGWNRPDLGRNPRNFSAHPPTPADHLAALVGWLQAEAPEVLAAYDAAQGNPPDVVRPTPSPFSGAQFATFSGDLVRPFILASCPERCCTQCGAGWAPFVEHHSHQAQASWSGSNRQNGCIAGGGHQGRTGQWSHTSTVHALLPTCPHYCACTPPCDADVPTCPTCDLLSHARHVPGTVLDPFAGSGTVGEVARELRRRSVLIEASPVYLQLARQRLSLAALQAWETTTDPTRCRLCEGSGANLLTLAAQDASDLATWRLLAAQYPCVACHGSGRHAPPLKLDDLPLFGGPHG